MAHPADPTHLPIEDLDAHSFAPYGEVIEARETARQFAINQGFATRFHDLAHVDAGPGEGVRVLLSIFRALPRDLPMQLQVMERHPLGSQAFVAMAELPFLVVVAEPAAQLQPAQIRCFLARPGQGVNYARGVWHHPLIALERPCDFLVIDRGGPLGDPNLDEIDVSAWKLWAG
jgi:ureidoglycolate lyase